MTDKEGRQEIPSELEAEDNEVLEKCSCGYDRYHHMVSALPTYTTWAQFWVILMGVSATPIRLDFKCRMCKETFDFTTSKKELEQFL
jgi:hypothetical protein